MSIFTVQNPGIGGLLELTDAEKLFIQNLVNQTYVTGDLLVYNGTNFVPLNPGSNTQVLTIVGGVPTWSAASSGGTPGGLDTQLQYNNAGNFGGISGATSNGTSVTFASGALLGTNLRASGSAGIEIQNNSGTNVIIAGAGGGTGISLLGTTNIGSGTDFLRVSGGSGFTVVAAEGSSASANLQLQAKGTTGIITLSTNSTERWRIDAAGVLQSVGAQTIRTATGNLVLGTNGGNGNVVISPNGTGVVELTGARTLRTSTGNLTLATGAANGNILLSPHGAGVVQLPTTASLHLSSIIPASGFGRLNILNNSASSPVTAWFGASPLITAFGEGSSGAGDLMIGHASDTASFRPVFIARRSRGTLASPTAVLNNDQIFSFLASGYDGTNFQNPALIDFIVDGVPSAGSVPMRIALVTGTSGASRGERLSVLNTGEVELRRGTNAGELRIYEGSGDGTNYSAFRGSARADNITYLMPTGNPTAGQAIVAGAPSGGLSQLSFATVGGNQYVLTSVPDGFYTNQVPFIFAGGDGIATNQLMGFDVNGINTSVIGARRSYTSFSSNNSTCRFLTNLPNQIDALGGENRSYTSSGDTIIVEFMCILPNRDFNLGFGNTSSNSLDGSITYTGQGITFTYNASTTTLTCRNANGSSATSTTITSTNLSRFNRYRIEYNSGQNIRYFVNGTIVATHTTNLPTSGVIWVGYGSPQSTTGQFIFMPIIYSVKI